MDAWGGMKTVNELMQMLVCCGAWVKRLMSSKLMTVDK